MDLFGQISKSKMKSQFLICRFYLISMRITYLASFIINWCGHGAVVKKTKKEQCGSHLIFLTTVSGLV